MPIIDGATEMVCDYNRFNHPNVRQNQWLEDWRTCRPMLHVTYMYTCVAYVYSTGRYWVDEHQACLCSLDVSIDVRRRGGLCNGSVIAAPLKPEASQQWCRPTCRVRKSEEQRDWTEWNCWRDKQRFDTNRPIFNGIWHNKIMSIIEGPTELVYMTADKELTIQG